MRGKRPQKRREPTQNRIIPARAGQTWSGHPWSGRSADHPRACGANLSWLVWWWPRNGSSPRVRGKLGGLPALVAHVRIIPARAGQTSACPRMRTASTDHPRACGANSEDVRRLLWSVGSSPRVRGKPFSSIRAPHLTRIIPARAGQTQRQGRLQHGRPDHPRACGANYLGRPDGRRDYGSSPRVRGKREPLDQQRVDGRIIPARAGQTAGYSLAVWVESDHPRACGANFVVNPDLEHLYGSSPRVRGKRRVLTAGLHAARIIPARAGQTRYPPACNTVNTDHPRACGANTDNGQTVATRNGSSPRVRGKLDRWEARRHRRRIIPARAGQTWLRRS